MKKVFLDGTWNGSEWRESLIPLLEIDYFNPIVENWTPSDHERELKEREECDFVLYTITPRMMGCYSIAEVVDDSNKRPEKTILCILNIDYDEDEDEELEWPESQVQSLVYVAEIVDKNGGKVFASLEEVADYLNSNKN